MLITRFSFVTDFPSSGVQALGENGNDGEAAEKWLAEQAQVADPVVHPCDDNFRSGSDNDFHF